MLLKGRFKSSQNVIREIKVGTTCYEVETVNSRHSSNCAICGKNPKRFRVKVRTAVMTKENNPSVLCGTTYANPAVQEHWFVLCESHALQLLNELPDKINNVPEAREYAAEHQTHLKPELARANTDLEIINNADEVVALAEDSELLTQHLFSWGEFIEASDGHSTFAPLIVRVTTPTHSFYLGAYGSTSSRDKAIEALFRKYPEIFHDADLFCLRITRQIKTAVVGKNWFNHEGREEDAQ